jgi:hypothetical protein
MRIHRVPDKFTTRSRQKIAAGGSASILSATCSRQISTQDSFATGSRQDQTCRKSWSRLCCSRFLANLRPQCDFYAVRRHHVILQAKTVSTLQTSPLNTEQIKLSLSLGDWTVSWRRNWLDTYFFGGLSSFATRSRQLSWTCHEWVVNLSGTRWITRIISFTTSSRQKIAAGGSASILSATRSRHVHDSFTTDFYSRLVRIFSVDHLQRHVITSRLVSDCCRERVANES